LIPGGGIGPEVTGAAVRILEASGVKIDSGNLRDQTACAMQTPRSARNDTLRGLNIAHAGISKKNKIAMKKISWLSFLMALALLGCNQSQPAPQPSSTPARPLVVVDASTAGTISGAISFKGAVPKFPLLDMTQDPGCPAQPQPSEAVVMKNGKLANVFVYVKDGLPQGSFPVPAEPVVLDQKGCRYIPHVMGVMVGQPLKVLNTDNALHNVHPMPRNNADWNESQMPMGKPIVETFEHPDIMVPVQCNQHPWMKAYVTVLAHPYFAVSGADGSFAIKNLPPGEYTLAAVHEKFGEQTMKIKVGAKESAKAEFVFSHQQNP
jgi:plastocyanin